MLSGEDCFVDGIEYIGNNLERIQVVDVKDCQNKCKQKAECDFFALLKHLKECMLGKYLTPQEDPKKMYKMDNLDTISGMKDCSDENEKGWSNFCTKGA